MSSEMQNSSTIVISIVVKGHWMFHISKTFVAYTNDSASVDDTAALTNIFFRTFIYFKK